MPPKVFADRVRQMLVIDYREELKRLAVPVLSLSGRYDLLVPPWNSRAIEKIVERHARSARVRSTGVSDGTHGAAGRPEESAAAISRMLVALHHRPVGRGGGPIRRAGWRLIRFLGPASVRVTSSGQAGGEYHLGFHKERRDGDAEFSRTGSAVR